MKRSLKKLPQELINQIAAGEVVERPASIVKELVDNSIDAGATQIKIRIANGGIDLIEVSDNGVGIEESNLRSVFEPHTTSKIESLEDLGKVMTMGFRGEALSTIRSIAKVSVSSKVEDIQTAFKLDFEKGEETKKSARNQGTTITINDIFYNTPARRKFLKTAQTEGRKITEILIPYFLQFPNIHFIFEKDGKEQYNLPSTSQISGLEIERIRTVIPSDFTRSLVHISSDGSGTKIIGFIGHPSSHATKTSHQYIFINKRPIWDNGIAKSVHLGYTTHIPRGEKVPFIISIEINPELVDVNVHPRKEEVKFINPYRVYSSVESSVSHALKETISANKPQHSVPPKNDSYNQVQYSQPNKLFDGSIAYENKSKEINFSKKGEDFSISKSLQFSKELLSAQTQPSFDSSESVSEITKILQVFNKYIVIEFTDELWMIDQHAAAERITFEKLMNSYNSRPDNIQSLLVPVEITGTSAEISFVEESLEFFTKLGFKLEIKDGKVYIHSIPAYFQQSDIETIFSHIWDLSDEQRDMKDSLEKARENIIATMACHSSIRSGQKLEPQEAMQIFNDLRNCENQYSCPHGRPIIWKMKLNEIDSNFERTY